MIPEELTNEDSLGGEQEQIAEEKARENCKRRKRNFMVKALAEVFADFIQQAPYKV